MITGIDRFRQFLIDVSSNKEPSEKAVLLQVLKQYCDDQSSASKDEVDFPDLLSTWSFAAQSNADSITSAVPAALAQFFRTISNELEFRDFGISLCHSLLKTDQVRLIDRGLSAPKHKDFMISPCLRLLTEVTSFDAGALAANVFSRRDILFRRLDALLNPPPRQREETDRRRPTVRRNAQRLLLALLRYLDAEAKDELVTQGKALYSCIRNLRLDGGDIVCDLLKTIRLSLLGPDLQKVTKTRFLNAANLQLFAELYDFEDEEFDEQPDVASVRQVAHDFLVHACTSNSAALISQTGWYPANFESNRHTEDDDDSAIDLGLDSPYYFDDYTTNVPVKNLNLSLFLQKLKPASDVLHAELVAKIFAAAPELVADYFCKRPKALGAPSDDNSWLGEFGFLYSIVDLPAPANLGYGEVLATSPPPLSIAAESILPRPLDRATTASFLKKNEELTVVSACRLLTVALQKLEAVLKLFRSAPNHRNLWDQAATKLSDLITARGPLYHEIVTALQKTAKENHTLRGAILECMAMYKKILPKATTSSSFDVSPVLFDILRQIREDEADEEAVEALHKQKAALVTIANLSRGTRWWHKAGSEELSPVVALLLDTASPRSGTKLDGVVSEVLCCIFREKGILCPTDQAWIALRESLGSSQPRLKDYDTTLLFFLENCMVRNAKQPVKYVEYMEEAQQEVSDSAPLSLLACAITEQWSHALKSDSLGTTVDFISKLFTLLAAGGENTAVLELFRSRMLEVSEDHKKHHKALKKAFKSQAQHPITPKPDAAEHTLAPTSAPEERQRKALHTATLFPPPPPVPSSSRPFPPSYTIESDLSTNPSTSRLALQIRAISSSTQELRLGALSTLTTLLPTLLSSSYPEATQLHLLLGELLETNRQRSMTTGNGSTTTPLPHIITELAILALTVITDPSDAMYGKINRWLLRAPHWHPLTRVLPFWMSRILLEEPESDAPGAVDAEILRLLGALADGLMRGNRTEADDDAGGEADADADASSAELCRRANLWERLGSLYLRPGCKREVRRAVLRCLWAVAGVPGGADTLITRGGVRAWLSVVLGRERGVEMREMVRVLRERIEERSDREYIRRWELGAVRKGIGKGDGKMSGGMEVDAVVGLGVH